MPSPTCTYMTAPTAGDFPVKVWLEDLEQVQFAERWSGIRFMNVEILCVPGPSRNPFNSGQVYFIEAVRAISDALGHLHPLVHAGTLDRHEVDSSLQSFDGIEICYHEWTRDEIGLDNTQMSSEHGALLNALVMEVRRSEAEYTIIVDPDFFVMPSLNLNDILRYMERTGIEVIGAPYPPDRIHQYWDFPVPFFQIWRSSVLKASEIDFRPRWERELLSRKRSEKIRLALDYRSMGILNKVAAMAGMWPSNELQDSRTAASYIARPVLFKFSARTFNSDTGYAIRDTLLGKVNHMCFEVAIPGEFPGPNLKEFDVGEYSRCNPDVPNDPEIIMWHARNVGIRSMRPLGRQKLKWRLAAAIGGFRRISSAEQPAHGLRRPEVVVDHGQRGDFYYWHGACVGVHLATRDKLGVDRDLEFITEVRSALMKGSR